MEKRIDDIHAKIINLRKIIKDFNERKRPLKSDSHKPPKKDNKNAKRAAKRKIVLYDEIPQEVLDKSYSIYKSSKLLKRFLVHKYFSKWASLYYEAIQENQIDELEEPQEKIENEDLQIHESNEEEVENENENRVPELNSEEQERNDDEDQMSLDRTEDKSKISLRTDDEEYSHEI